MRVIEIYNRWDRKVYLSAVSVSRIGAGLLLGMMILIVTDVFLRFFFDNPVQGTFELVEILMGAVVSLSIAYCGYKGGHVAVEIITEHMKDRSRSVIELIHSLISAAFFVVVAFKSAQQAIVIKESETVTTLLEIPVYPFIWVFVLGTSLLSLVYCWQFLGIIIRKRSL